MAPVQIVGVETFAVPPRWLFVRVETDTGVVGWGEPVVEGRVDTVRAAVDELSALLLGADPMRIEDHWQRMTKSGFYRGGPVLSSAVAGLDQALWDIAGRSLGVPVHQLLGGPVRDRIRVYGWVGGDDPSEVAEAVAARVDSGFTAVKMNASGAMPPLAAAEALDAVEARVHSAREVLGPGRDVAIDLHGRFALADARRLAARLEPLQPMFLEEPVIPENSHLLGRLVAGTVLPIATGERLYSRQEFLPALQAGVAVVQPDLSHAGGISEVLRIASLAEVYGAHLAPHCPLGPIALAASLQVGFAAPNHLIQEQSIGIHYNEGADVLDYVVDTAPLRFIDGYVERLTGPGLGIEVDDAAVRSADATRERWQTPTWRHADGSYAEW